MNEVDLLLLEILGDLYESSAPWDLLPVSALDDKYAHALVMAKEIQVRGVLCEFEEGEWDLL